MSRSVLIEHAVDKLHEFARLYGLESLFIVGGYTRALIMKHMEDVDDIDVSSAYPGSAMRLGGLFASEMLKSPVFYHRTGTCCVEYSEGDSKIRIEFQSDSIHGYMHNEEVINWLRKHHVSPLPIYNNVFGRDFTINTLIYSLKNKKLYDITRMAVRDLENKLIRSVLPAEMLVKYNPISVLRAIRFSCKYDFHIDKEMRSAMRNTSSLISKYINSDRILLEVEKTIKCNPEAAIEKLSEYGLINLVSKKDLKNILENLE